jgi:hypothetical protein
MEQRIDFRFQAEVSLFRQNLFFLFPGTFIGKVLFKKADDLLIPLKEPGLIVGGVDACGNPDAHQGAQDEGI